MGGETTATLHGGSARAAAAAAAASAAPVFSPAADTRQPLPPSPSPSPPFRTSSPPPPSPSSSPPSPSPSPSQPPPVDLRAVTDPAERRGHVRRTVRAAWGAYWRHARGADELHPLERRPVFWLGDAGNRQMLQLVDAMDTLRVVGLEDEFDDAVEHCAAHYSFSPGTYVSLFETTIRLVGGLLAAYAQTRRPRLLALAVQTADAIAPAYSPVTVKAYGGGLPLHGWHVGLRQPSLGWSTNIAEAGSVQLENAVLSYLTKNPSYAERTAGLYDVFERHTLPNGLLRPAWNRRDRVFEGELTTGANADSYYEYLLKVWLLTGRTDARLERMYTRAADGIVGVLVRPFSARSSVVRSGAWVEAEGRLVDRGEFEHLQCFVPGMLALGARYLTDNATAARHLDAAVRIANFCAMLYFDSPTTLAPEVVAYSIPDGDGSRGTAAKAAATATPGVDAAGESLGSTKRVRHAFYNLRPEALESFFYLHRATGDPLYREWGWRIYAAVEAQCRVCAECDVSGYSEVADAGVSPVRLTGVMPTWFLAETAKYLYLLLSEEDALDLDCWVLNTEAHPLPVLPSPNLPKKCSFFKTRRR